MDSSSVDNARLQSLIEGEKMKAMANEMVAKVTYVCWDKCITGSIGKSFSSSEVACLSNCAKRFVEFKQLTVQHLSNSR